MSKQPETNNISKKNQSNNPPEISIEKDKPLNIKHVVLILTGIAVLTFLAYYPSFKNKILNWDDDTYIIYNPYIHSFALDNVKTMFTRGYFNNYHPLTMLSYNLDYNIGKADPEVYIITNLILHILNTFLVFWFIFLLAKLPAGNKENIFNGKKPFYLAAIASLLFALHPVNVESVAWISERKNLLCTFFFILSLISYIKYLNHKRFLFYYVSLILFLFSLFSKGIAVSLSFSIVALDYLYARKLLSVKVVLKKVPFFLLSLAFGIIALHCQGLKNVGAGNSFINQLFFAAYGFIAYLFNLILPVNLSGFYSYPHGIHFIHVICFILALAIITILFIFRKKLSRLVIFSILFFLANIIFQLQLIPVGKSIMADRYIYISSIGFFLIVAFIILKIAPRYRIVYILLSISLLLFGYATHEHVKEWNNSLLFWDTVIGKDPSNSLAWRNRGSAKANKKDYQGALADFRKSIELNPDDPVAFYDEGLIKIDNGDYNGGLEDFNTVLKIQPLYTKCIVL